jgi:hypothetical protein
MIGGQINKATRRFGVPSIALTAMLYRTMKGQKGRGEKEWAKTLVILLAIPVLSMGYGINSVIGKTFKKEWIIRTMYAIILSIPLELYALLTLNNQAHLTLKCTFILIALILAFQVRDTWLGKLRHKLTIGKFNLLFEDIVRSLTFGYSIVWLIT